MSKLRCTPHWSLVLLAVLLTTALLGALAHAAVRISPTIARVQAQGLIRDVPEKAIQMPPARLAQVKQNKQVANVQRLQQSFFVRNNVPFIRGAEGEEFQLIPLAKMEYAPNNAEITRATRVLPKVLSALNYINAGAVMVEIPQVVDHRPDQTPVKNQNPRGTCVCFASMAGLEVAYGGGSLDLSENYANYLYMKAEGRGCKSDGLQTHNSANYLAANGVCIESKCPYQTSFPSWCNNGGTPNPAKRTDAAAHSPFKIASYQKIWRKDDLTTDTGIWINNPRYLETLLRAGYDIVFGTHVAGWSNPYTGVIDVKLGPTGNPLPSVGGHAMLVVGYDRPNEYFIVKNSWGTSKGQAGYVYLSYDYIRTYAKYGYVITDVEPLPLVLVQPMLRALPMMRAR